MDQANVASSLAAGAKEMWAHYTCVGQAEHLLAKTKSPTHLLAVEVKEQKRQEASKSYKEDNKRVEIKEREKSKLADVSLQNSNFVEDWEIAHVEEVVCFDGGLAEDVVELECKRVVAECLVTELKSELAAVTAAQAQTKFWEANGEKYIAAEPQVRVEGLQLESDFDGSGHTNDVTGGKEQTEGVGSEVGNEDKSAVLDVAVSEGSEREVARCLVKELKSELAALAATQAEKRYWKVLGEKGYLDIDGGQLHDSDDGLCLEGDLSDVRLDDQDQTLYQSRNGHADMQPRDVMERLSLKGDLSGHDHEDDVIGGLAQAQNYHVCDEDESEFVCSNDISEDAVAHTTHYDQAKESILPGGVCGKSPEVLSCNGNLTLFSSPCASSLLVSEKITPTTCDAATNTLLTSHEDRASSPAPPPPLMSHAFSQTILSISDLITRTKEKEELELLKVDLHVARGSLNQEKSQRMVAEELIKIIQSDLSAVSSRNTTEVMTRLQLENELTDIKVGSN